jgi:hypothetical protein
VNHGGKECRAAICKARSLSRRRSASGGTDIGKKADSRFFEIPRVLVRFNHVASLIVNSNHSIMYAAVKRPDVLSEVTPEISQPERDCHLKSGLIRRSQFHYLLGPFLRARDKTEDESNDLADTRNC